LQSRFGNIVLAKSCM